VLCEGAVELQAGVRQGNRGSGEVPAEGNGEEAEEEKDVSFRAERVKS